MARELRCKGCDRLQATIVEGKLSKYMAVYCFACESVKAKKEDWSVPEFLRRFAKNKQQGD